MTNTGDDTRKEQIMDAVIKLVATVGIDKMSIRQIAQEAGVSHALVTYHYGNKTQLVGEAWSTVLERYGARVHAEIGDTPGLEHLEVAFRLAFLDRDEQMPPWRFWVEYWAEATRTESLNQYQAPRFERNRQNYGASIRGAIKAGHLAPDYTDDPQLTGDLFQALMYGLAVQTSLDEKTFSRERAFAIVKHALDLLRSAARPE